MFSQQHPGHQGFLRMLQVSYQLWRRVIEKVFTVSPLSYQTYELKESGWVRTALNSSNLGGAESSKINTTHSLWINLQYCNASQTVFLLFYRDPNFAWAKQVATFLVFSKKDWKGAYTDANLPFWCMKCHHYHLILSNYLISIFGSS